MSSIFQVNDDCGARHWVFADDEDDARALLEDEEAFGDAQVESIEELTIFEATEVPWVEDDGSRSTLAHQYELDPMRRYVGGSEW